MLNEKVRIALAAGPEQISPTHPDAIKYGKKKESAREFAERIALLALSVPSDIKTTTVPECGTLPNAWMSPDGSSLITHKEREYFIKKWPAQVQSLTVPLYAEPQVSNPAPHEFASSDKARSLGANNTDAGELPAASAPIARSTSGAHDQSASCVELTPELDKALLDLDDFLNNPPQYESQLRVREYRAEVYPLFANVVKAIRAQVPAEKEPK